METNVFVMDKNGDLWKKNGHNSRRSMEFQELLQKIDALLTEKLKDIKPKYNFRSDDINDLTTALAKAQSEMIIAVPNKENPYFKNRYADLLSIINATRPALTKNGLSVVQNIIQSDDGQMLHTILFHTSGQYIESRMRIVPPKNDIQTIHSYSTYLKRIAYSSLIGVVTPGDDDDGEIAMLQSREMIAKGPSVKYDPREQSYEVITKEQLEELHYELEQYPDLAEEVMTRLAIQSLADMPKSKYKSSIERIRHIVASRNGVKIGSK